MPKDYKICKSCGAKVDLNANFCPECKSQSFKRTSIVLQNSNEPVSLKHRLLYWNYGGEFVLSKSKLAGIIVFVLFFIGGLTTNVAGGFFLLALILGAMTFLIGCLPHFLRGEPTDAVIRYNDYGLIPDLYHLFFFWQNKNTGEFVPSKTKIISFIIFLVFCILSAAQYTQYTLFVIVMVGLFFETPVFLLGYGIHKLINPNPTNPKQIPGKKQGRIPERQKVEHTIDEMYEEPKVISKFKDYENKINELKAEYEAKEKVARELIEKRFAPPQITYTRFISVVDKSSEIFKKESDSAMNILHLASEDSPRIDRELDSKIKILESIIDKTEDLTNELVLSMDSTKDDDAKNLIDDMENLVSSVKDYEN